MFNDPECIKTEPVNWCVSSNVSPNLVEPDEYKTEDETIVTLYSVAVIVPSINTFVFILKSPSSNEALTLPDVILNNSNPVIPLDGILYNPLPSPLIVPSSTFNEPVIWRSLVVA